jgi:hypothetical protein
MDDHTVAIVLVYMATGHVVSTAAALAQYTKKPGCNSLINPSIVAQVIEWYIPALIIAATASTVLSDHRWRTRLMSILVLPVAVLYTSILTTTCPAEYTLNFNEWALATDTPDNSTSTFVPAAVDIQWRGAIVYTALGALLLLVPMNRPFRLRLGSKPYLALLSMISAILLLAMPITVNKTDAPVLCRGGAGNRDKVFDTTTTGYGPLSGRGFDVPVSLILVFSIGVLVPRPTWSRISTIGVFISSGVYIALILHTLRNPGCTSGIHNLDSIVVRVSTIVIVYTWLVRVLTLVPDIPPEYKSIGGHY